LLHGTRETCFHKGPREPLLRREVESLRPPSPEVICCLAGVPGESRDSGLGLGLDARADSGISSGASRTIRGKSRDPLPFSKSGLITGDSGSGQISGHDRRGAGKSATGRGREKHAYFRKKKNWLNRLGFRGLRSGEYSALETRWNSKSRA
jgi:hypothetical protein